MKKFTIVVLSLLPCFMGCTAPSQRVAADALQRGVDQEHSIVSDLSTIAKQSAVDNGVAEARTAAANGNADAAQAAVEKAVSQFDKIGWLQIQHERARSMIRVAQTYIWSQKGIFDIMVKEFEEAKNRAEQPEVPE